MARFIKLLTDEGVEKVFNLDMIWKVEVTYVEPDPNRPNLYWHCFRELAVGDPKAIRMYRVHIGTDSFGVPANPDNPLSQYIEDICKSAHS